MKRFWSIAMIFALASVSFAAPWSAQSDFVEVNKRALRDKRKIPYLLDEIARKQPIKIYAANPDIKVIAERSYMRWAKTSTAFIRHAGREKEFADIIDLLENHMRIEHVEDPAKANILISVVTDEKFTDLCDPDALACYSRKFTGGVPSIIMPAFLLNDYKHMFNVLTHEIGHSLGLGDQYQIDNADKFVHLIYSTPQSIKESIMCNEWEPISCDDVDGIINLIDLARDKFHGGEKGWKSFCKEPGYTYVYGIPVGKGPFLLEEDPFDFHTIVMSTVTKDGKKVKEQRFTFSDKYPSYPFETHHFSTLEKNAAGLPVHQRGENGEDVFSMESKGFTESIVVKNGEILMMSGSFDLNGAAVKYISFMQENEMNVIVLTKAESFRNLLFFGNIDEDVNFSYSAYFEMPNEGDMTEVWNKSYTEAQAKLLSIIASKAHSPLFRSILRFKQDRETKKHEQLRNNLIHLLTNF